MKSFKFEISNPKPSRVVTRRSSLIIHRTLSAAFFLLLAVYYSLLATSGSPLTVSARSAWAKQRSGTLAWLHAVYFVDEARGWAAGRKGALLSTTDGGATWRVEPPPAEDALRDIFFTDERTGWIVCERSIYLLRTKEEPRSYLLKTEDGGATWARVEIKGLDPDAVLARVTFTDAAHGWVMGETGLLYATTDGGRSWKRQSVPTRHLLLGAHFLDARTGWLAGAGATLLRTTDGGATWQAGRIETTIAPSHAPTSLRFNALTFVDARRGWAVGAKGALYATEDGGQTWRALNSSVGEDLLDIKFFDAREGYVAGGGGTILHTRDGGATWSAERTDTTHQLERLFFVGRGRGWAVGFGGTVITKSGVHGKL